MALVRADFGEVRLAEEATWQEGGLIPKGKGDYRGIGLMVVVLKVVVVILHRCLTASITHPNFLHEFWAGRGTGNANLDAKLINQLVAMNEEVLNIIFLDL